ncbi:uncharacterized protein [Euphorbia lathyris]|uniref:uncharacterized protein n=1 Tax=Euphorbia lathyris TaxID=212925 RepID=UPI003313B796
MAAARYLGKKESMKASLMKLHYCSSPYVDSSARVSSTTTQERREEGDEKSRTREYVADIGKEGVRKAREIADEAKKSLDGAWETAKDNILDRNEENYNINEEDPVVDEMKKLDGPVDTVAYRNMDTNHKL